MFIYLIQLASVSMYSYHTDHRFHGWLNLLSRPNSTDNSPARSGYVTRWGCPVFSVQPQKE